MNCKKNLVAGLALGACALASALCPSSAHAFGYETHNGAVVRWPGNSFIMRMSPGLSAAHQDAITQVRNRWYQNPSAAYFDVVLDNDSTVASGNGENEIAFTSNPSLHGGAPARAMRWTSSTGEILEADIFLNTAESYTTSVTKTNLWEYGGGFRPIQTTLMHEFGHAIGLMHENGAYNIMGQDWTHLSVNGSNAVAYPGEDASNGAVFLYGLTSSTWGFEDVGVVHWKYDPATSGEYSWHERTGVYFGGSPLPSFNVDEEPVYQVWKGMTVGVEFTYENNGRTTQQPQLGIYLSTNDYISTADTLLLSTSISLQRNQPSTTIKSVTLPMSLTSGTIYYLGAILDGGNAIAETNESNNRAYVAIQVQ